MTQKKEMYEFTDDFRISAYALGEATPEEAAQLEAMIAENPTLQDEIDAIRGFSTQITEALENEPLPEKPEVSANMPKAASPKTVRSHRWLTVAVALLVVLTGGVFLFPPTTNYRRIVCVEAPAPPNFSDTASPEKEPLPQAPERYRRDEAKSEKVLADPTMEVIPMDSAAEMPRVRSLPVIDQDAMPAPAMAQAPAKTSSDGARISVMKAKAAQNDAVFLASEGAGDVAEKNLVEEHMDRGNFLPEPLPKPESKPISDRNSYQHWEENKFQTPTEAPFSTFGVDVDTASYSFTRQYLAEYGSLPNPDAIRVEEFINSFDYDLPQPKPDEKCPFATSVEIQKHPWAAGRYMARVSLKGREIPKETRPPLNLVFLLDVSGSMSDWNKLPLVKDGMMRLLDQLGEKDYVTIVTYANDSGVRLEPTCGAERSKIEKAILELNAGGGTSGAAGIQTAYQAARKHFHKESVNRVILCTDGDFNIGMTHNDELEKLIANEAKSGVFLTVLGFGMGNYHDDRLQTLSSQGNGNYGYVDSREEAKRLLCDDLCGTLITIAKDVKLQIEFNPANVAAYRLIGYENRRLNDADFHNDKKDSGDIGAGHCVTALYEIVPVGGEIPDSTRIDSPRYQKTEPSQTEPQAAPQPAEKPTEKTDEWMFLKLRYKLPNENVSSLLEIPVSFQPEKMGTPSANFQWASGVALFAMLLRHSDYTENATFDTVLEQIRPVVGDDPQRKELEALVLKAKEL
ncbi:MAG: von Willebrand factor type A domain-containing protein [Planctomycetia bacterium]|nr:von Willebrand factor type A domain-containing protein [Planctomycetia bacterium]